MRRLLPLAILLACGDETVGTATDASTSSAPTTTSTSPTTTGATTSTTSPTTSSASDGATTSGDPSTSSPSTGTTEAIDPTTGGSSTTAPDDTTSSSSTTGTTGTTTTSETTSDETTTTSADTTTTGVETGDDPDPMGICTQGEFSTFIDPMPQPVELHMIGVYQATANALTVSVTREGIPMTLYLSAYEPVAFTLDLAPGVQLEHVILNGYNQHTVQGQGAATVTNISADFNDPFWANCGYFWPMNDGGCDTPANVESAEQQTGLSLTTFAGCYEASSFTLD